MGLKEETIIKIIEECIKPLSGLKNGFEKQENRADEIAENLPPEKYPSVSAVIAFVKNKIEVFSEAVGKVYLKATDFEDYKTDASKTYATKTDVEDFENNVAKTYATKTDVEDLKTDTEVIATATGKAITIESAKAPLQNLKLFGKTEQATTRGKNKLPYPYSDTTLTESGVTFTDLGDGGIKISGTCTCSIYAFNICSQSKTEIMNNLEVGKSYVISSGNSTIKPQVFLYYNDNGTEKASTTTSGFTMEEKYTSCAVMLEIQEGTTYNTTIYPMILLSTETDTTYEQYTGGIASPNPDYPQELVSIGNSGSYSVDLYGKNLLEVTATTQTVNGVTFTVNADKSIKVSGTATADAYCNLDFKNTNLVIGEQYLVSVSKTNVGVSIWYDYFDTLGAIKSIWSSYTKFEMTIPSDYFRNRIFIRVNKGVTVNTTIYPMILLATETDNTYEPYTKQTLTLTDTLRGIGDIKDEIDFARGVKTTDYELFTLTTVSSVDELTNCLRIGVFLTKTPNRAESLCSHLPFLESYGRDTEHFYCATHSNLAYLFINKSRVSAYDKDTIQAWIVEQGIKILFSITPIETALTETELNAYRQLYTNKGNTTILSEADMEISYYVNKLNAQAIGSLHEQINKDYLKLQQAIISTGGN